MAVHNLVLRYTERTPVRLDDFLLAALPAALERVPDAPVLSKSKLRRLVVAGAVSVGGKQTRNMSQPLAPGAKIAVRFDTEKFAFEKQPDDIAFELTAERILFEDELVIVVDKPAGFPTEATMVASRDHLHAAVTRFLALRDGIENPYIGLHHRLDRETSGVILFTKDRKANTAVHKMFLEHLARKTYQALALRPEKMPKAVFTVENDIGRISAKSAAGKWGAVKTGGDHAFTSFRILETGKHALFVEAVPLTGRTHQIRVHLAGEGLPILGDTLYGGSAQEGGVRFPRVMLHAGTLAFPHPGDGRTVTVSAPIPADFIEGLAALRNGKL